MRPNQRRICWPEATDACLQGGCEWCNESPFLALTVIEAGLTTDAQWVAWRHGKACDFATAQVRTGPVGRR